MQQNRLRIHVVENAQNEVQTFLNARSVQNTRLIYSIGAQEKSENLLTCFFFRFLFITWTMHLISYDVREFCSRTRVFYLYLLPLSLFIY